MKGLISFCAYGDSVKYILGLYDNITASKSVYPGWDIRVYVPSCSYLKDKINERFPWVDVVVKEPIVSIKARLWRFEALWDRSYTHVIVRDTDSIVTGREAGLVNQWIESGKSMHVIYDHPHHNAPMLSGMIGAKTSDMHRFSEPYADWYDNGGDDTQFLAACVYPYMHSILTHTSVENQCAKGDIVTILSAEDFVGKPRTPDLFKYLTKFFVLNPDRYKKRYEKFLKEVEKSKILSGMECIRFRGRTLDEDIPPYWCNQNLPHYWLATQDHKQMLREALIRNDDLTLIFEDDATLCSDFDWKLAKFIEDADHCMYSGKNFNRWTALMLGGSPMGTIYSHMHRVTKDLQMSVGTYGMQSVLYNYAGLHGLYGHSLYHNHENIDVAFAGYQREYKSVYAPNEWLVDQTGPQEGKDE